MAQEEASAQIRALQKINAKRAPKAFTDNIQKLNYDTEYMAKYLVVMQKGIDDGNKNIFEKVGDLIENLIIIFTGGGDIGEMFQGLKDAFIHAMQNIPIIGDLIEIFTGIEDGNMQDLGTWVGNLLDMLFGGFRNSNRVLLELQAKLAEGATYSDTFDRSDSPSSLGNGWTQGGAGSALGIIGNAARIDGLPFSTGRRYAICPKKADKDDMAVSVGVNNKGIAPAAMTTLFLQSNEDLTEFVYANLYKKAFYIGRGTRSGNTWTFNDWKQNTSKQIVEGGMVTFTAEDILDNTGAPTGTCNYKLTSNGETLVEHVDALYPRNELHRWSGFAQETKIVGIIPQISWGLVAYTMRSQVDLTPVEEYVGNLSKPGGAINAVETSVGVVADAVNKIVGEQTGEGNQGSNFFYNFTERATGNTLTDFDHQTPGAIGILPSTFWCGIQIGGAVKARMWTKNVLGSSDHQISVVLGDSTLADADTELHVRVNAAGTSGMALRLATTTCSLWSWTAPSPSGVAVYTKIGPDIAMKFAAGDTIALQAVGSNMTILKNRSLVTTISAPFAPSGTKCGLAFFQAAGLFTFHPARIRSMSISDLAKPTYRGVGFRMVRTNVTATSNTTGDNQSLPANTFDTILERSGIDAYYEGGQVGIWRAGYYQFNARVGFNSDPNSGQSFNISLFRNSGSGWVRMARGSDFSGISRNCSLSTSFYCNEGDAVILGVYTNNGHGIVGGTDGSVTYFSGFLGSN